MSRVMRPLVVVTLFAAATAVMRHASPDPFATAVDSLAYRGSEGRLARPYPHKPYRRATAVIYNEASLGMRQGSTAKARTSDPERDTGATLLLNGRAGDAFSLFLDLLRQQSEATDELQIIQASTDAALLADFSAAALERGGDRDLLLAYEAADRAWQLSQSVAAGWNRALAAQRIGMYPFAERAWREIRERESDPEWAREAEERRADAERRAKAAPPPTLELFFYRDLFKRILAGEAPADILAEDRLASDTNAAVARLTDPSERLRLRAALEEYLRGYAAVERNEVAAGSQAYARAEAELDALRVPLAWIVRDQRIRCDCVLRKPGCLDTIRAFGREVAANGRYRWLAGRLVYADAYTLYRQGRMYEAALLFEQALAEYERVGDITAAAQMRSLLTNVYAAGGESDLALRHYLRGLPIRTPRDLVDRRRRILEDGIVFMSRHGYLATAELLLDELGTEAVTDAAKASRATLRGVAAFRRGDLRSTLERFTEARMLLRGLPDATTREDLRFRLAIAEAGTGMQPASATLADLDAGIDLQSGPELSIWLPPLLAARGATFENANDLDRAEADYRRAIDVLESREPRIDQSVLALGLSAPGESPFDRLIRLLLRQGRVVDALSIADRASGLRISSLHARGAGVRDVFQPLRERGDGIAEARRALRSGEVAVTQYLLRDEVVAWVITKDAVVAVRQPVRREELVRAAEQLQRCSAQECELAVATLSGALLQPWIERVPRGATLLLQGAAELEAVPFAMLATRDRERLVLRNPSATVPTLRALARAARQDATRAGDVSAFFAAAAAPGGTLEPLPRAIPEVTRSSQRYASPTVEPSATRERFLARSPAHTLVHFAGHIVVDPARPLYSALVFDEGELLYVHELDERSFANARLVVLSACDSGRTPRPAMSVANALLSQNVPSVVYTFRSIDDQVGEAFALAFHRALSEGKSRAEAVRDAQLSLMRARPDDPTTWAAFALAGATGPMNESEAE